MLVSNAMAIYHGIFNLIKSRYSSKLPWYFYNTGQNYHNILTLEKGGATVNYCNSFITLAPGEFERQKVGRSEWQGVKPLIFKISEDYTGNCPMLMLTNTVEPASWANFS
jgi:hypothetical protein